MLNVIIADDHPVIRQGLRRHFRAHGDITVVAEAANASDLLAHVERCPCDVLILDISLGSTSAFEILAKIQAVRPSLPIVLFTRHEHAAYVHAAWLRGVVGYVTKGRPVEELMTAVRLAIKGIRYVSPPLDSVIDTAIPFHAKPLSPRQQQILRLRSLGQLASEIGRALGITAKTVATHEDIILQKLHLHSRHELLSYCARLEARQGQGESSLASLPVCYPNSANMRWIDSHSSEMDLDEEDKTQSSRDIGSS